MNRLENGDYDAKESGTRVERPTDGSRHIDAKYNNDRVTSYVSYRVYPKINFAKEYSIDRTFPFVFCEYHDYKFFQALASGGNFPEHFMIGISLDGSLKRRIRENSFLSGDSK